MSLSYVSYKVVDDGSWNVNMLYSLLCIVVVGIYFYSKHQSTKL